MNSVCCYPAQEENAKPSKVHLQQCRPNLKAQLEQVDGPWVLAVGAYALKAMVRHSGGVTAAQGAIIPVHGRLIYPVFHPSYILRVGEPDLENEWMRQLERFAHLRTLPREDIQLMIEFQGTCFYCGDVNFPGSHTCHAHANDWRLDQAWEPSRRIKLDKIPGQTSLL